MSYTDYEITYPPDGLLAKWCERYFLATGIYPKIIRVNDDEGLKLTEITCIEPDKLKIDLQINKPITIGNVEIKVNE